MSTFALFTAGLAVFAPFASAYTQPKGDTPEGNAISEPGLNSVVPAGQPFTITWDPSTEGKVSLLLCKGPSTNCAIIKTLADSIDNSGKYDWTPTTDLEPSQPTGYGIELVVEGTGQYQYSTQFGISNPSFSEKDASSSSASVTSAQASSSAAAAASVNLGVSVDDGVNTNNKVASDDSTSASVASTPVSSTSVVSSSNGPSTAPALALSTGASSAAAVASDATASAGLGSATGSMPGPSSLRTSYSSASGSASASGSRTASQSATAASGSASASATHSGSAGQISASLGGLAVAAGIAVFAL